MEAVGFAISVAGIISLFQTCVHGYRTFQTALEMGDIAPAMGIQFAVEEKRLELWGRSRGITFSSENKNDGSRVQEHDVPDSDILQIPGLRDLVRRILERIQEVQKRQTELIKNYGVPSAAKGQEDAKPQHRPSDSSVDQTPPTRVSYGSRASAKSKQARRKFTWAVRDKASLTDMLNELKALNDGLQNLLPKGDVDTICQSLAGEIINADMKLESLTDDELGEMGLKVAKTIELRRVNMTSVLAQSAFSKVQYGDDAGEETSPYFIPTSCFVGFTEPRIKTGMPISRHIYDYQSPEASRQKEVVLVEWRSADAESKHSTITREELTSRRSHVVSLLHRTSVSDHDYRVLNCLGFCLATARMSNGDTQRVVGFVYQLPTHAASHIMPVSLREIIGDAFVSPEPSIPSLDDRYQLARTLAVCLYHLQCAGWIHRKISSYNILFFKDGASGKVDITRPYLAGWQYARPDGEDFPLAAIRFKTEGYALGSISLGDFGMYIHPSRWIDEWGPAHDSQASKLPPFQKVHDIYSFGVVLVEIAFWEPIFALVSSEKREKMKALEVCERWDNVRWPLDIRATAEKELASEMGVSYRNAVLNCLQGLDNVEDGVEKQFFWQVVDKLKYTCITE